MTKFFQKIQKKPLLGPFFSSNFGQRWIFLENSAISEKNAELMERKKDRQTDRQTDRHRWFYRTLRRMGVPTRSLMNTFLTQNYFYYLQACHWDASAKRSARVDNHPCKISPWGAFLPLHLLCSILEKIKISSLLLSDIRKIHIHNFYKTFHNVTLNIRLFFQKHILLKGWVTYRYLYEYLICRKQDDPPPPAICVNPRISIKLTVF